MTQIKLDKNIFQQVSGHKQKHWEVGTILQGTVMGQEKDQLSIQMEGIQFKTNTPQGFQGQVGSTVSFQVQQVNGNQMVLKMIEDWEKGEEEGNQGVKQYDSLHSMLNKADIPVNQENMETAKVMLDNGFTIDKETFQAVATAKKNIDEVIHRITQKDVEQIHEQGYSLDKLGLDMMNNFLGNLSKDSDQSLTEEEITQTIEQYGSKYGQNSEDIEKIRKAIEALLKKGIPITQKNIAALVDAQRKMEEVQRIDDTAIGKMISKDWDITLENLYKAQYSGGKTLGDSQGKYGSNPYEQAIGASSNVPMEDQILDKEIERILKQEGLPLTEENKKAARLLALQQLPVSRKNIEKVIATKEAVAQMDAEKLLEKAVQNMKEKQPITHISIGSMEDKKQENPPLSTEEINNIVRKLPKLGEDAIRWVLNKQLPLTLKNLQEAPVESESNADTPMADVDKVITGKRQLAEIQLKLTSEAAMRLNGKGIAIDTVPLQRLVEELRGVERETYSTQLRQAGAPVTEENIQQMEQIMEKVEGLSKISPQVLGQVMNQRIPFTLEGLNETQIQTVSVEQAAVSMYETLGTHPEAKFGDSISKIVDQIGPLLTEQGIEPSEANIRAARILVQNQIPITEENLIHVKMLDQKVTQMIQEFHPAIAANMIKDQVNPIPMHIDEVLQYMKKFEGLLGQDVSEKLSQYILEMDDKNTLNPEQREAMIGIYRMFHKIQHGEGRTIGFLIKNNMELTLNNLLEATKYLDRTYGRYTDVDVKINDQFGALHELIRGDKSIRNQLEKVFADAQMAMTEENVNKATRLQEEGLPVQKENLTKMAYMQESVKQLISRLSPQVAEGLLKELPAVREMSVDQILEEIEKFETTNNLQKTNSQAQEVRQFLQGLQQLENMKQSTLGLMEKYNIPFTLKNMMLFQQMEKEPFLFGDKLQELENFLTEQGREELGLRPQIENSLKDLGEGRPVDEIMDEIKRNAEDVKQEAIGFSSNERQWIWNRTSEIERMADIQKQIQKDEQIYQIPIQLHNGLSHINLYVTKDGKNKNAYEKDGFRAFISLSTENMGTVQVYMKVQGQNIDFDINAEKMEDTQFLQQNGEGLKETIEAIGYKINKIQYGIENPKNPLSEEIEMNQTEFTKRRISTEGFEITI